MKGGYSPNKKGKNQTRKLYSVKECIHALQLYIAGKRICDISRELAIPYCVVDSWVKGKHLPSDLAFEQQLLEETIPPNIELWKWSYLAGVIDADGYIGICKYANPSGSYHYKPRLAIVGDRKLIDWLNENITKGHVNVKHEPNVLTWSVFRKKDLRIILRNIIPFMTTKKRRAELVLELVSLPLNKHNVKRREEIYREFRKIMDAWHESLKHRKRNKNIKMR